MRTKSGATRPVSAKTAARIAARTLTLQKPFEFADLARGVQMAMNGIASYEHPELTAWRDGEEAQSTSTPRGRPVFSDRR